MIEMFGLIQKQQKNRIINYPVFNMELFTQRSNKINIKNISVDIKNRLIFCEIKIAN